MRYGTEQIMIFARHFLLLTTLLVGPFVCASSDKPNQIELEDMALFRLSGQVFTLSDLKKTQKAFHIFKCVKGKSYLEVLLDVKPSEFSEFTISPESQDLGEGRDRKSVV